jgi:hypothetical protein
MNKPTPDELQIWRENYVTKYFFRELYERAAEVSRDLVSGRTVAENDAVTTLARTVRWLGRKDELDYSISFIERNKE